MINWYECQPDFLLPINIDCGDFPDYTDLLARALDVPDPSSLVVVGPDRGVQKWAWGAWFQAQRADRLPNLPESVALDIANNIYESKRFVATVPAWRRWMIEALTEVDDIEDQVSTILWILETISRKVVPIPPTLMNAGDLVKRSLNAAELALGGGIYSRSAKHQYVEALRTVSARKRGARARVARLLDWLKRNFGRMLEAAQASEQWFDVGIILGPLFGYIEEGIWTLALKTLDNYLIAADAILPGYRELFYINAQELADSVDAAWESTWEAIDSFDNDPIFEEIGFGA